MALVDKMKGAAVGLAMLGIGSNCYAGGLSLYGKALGRDFLLGGIRQGIESGVRSEVEGRRDEMNVGVENLSKSDKDLLDEIERSPRVVCQGDVDGDGDAEWAYYDGKGNGYRASMIFKNEKGEYLHLHEKKGLFNERGFVYCDMKTMTIHKVPEKAFVIWYRNH